MTVLDQLSRSGAVGENVDPLLTCIMVCGVAATVEEGRLDTGRRRALLTMLIEGLLDPRSARSPTSAEPAASGA